MTCTCGSAIFGYCAMGSPGMTTEPESTMIIAQTMANTTRRMKKSTMIASLSLLGQGRRRGLRELDGLFHRQVHVRFEVRVVVDAGQLRLRRDHVADFDGNVTHRAIEGCGDAEVVQLRALRGDARLLRIHVLLRDHARASRLIEL